MHSAANAKDAALTFKEGAQVRLECQSTGGRPAPRIEWLNVTRRHTNLSDQSKPIVQLMRLHWPQKKLVATSFEPGDHKRHQQLPVTSSAVSFALSRYDLHSEFACLVLPTYLAMSNSQQQPLQQTPVEQLIKSPVYLNSLFNQRQSLASEAAGTLAPMLKWIKLEVQG